MITLVGGNVMGANGQRIPNGYVVDFELNTDATVIASPFGIIPGKAGAPEVTDVVAISRDCGLNGRYKLLPWQATAKSSWNSRCSTAADRL